MIVVDLFVMLDENDKILSISTKGVDLLKKSASTINVKVSFEPWTFKDAMSFGAQGEPDGVQGLSAYVDYALTHKLSSWNLTDKYGNDIPCTKDSFENLPATIGSQIIGAYFDKVESEVRWIAEQDLVAHPDWDKQSSEKFKMLDI